MAHELILIVDDSDQNRRLARKVLQFAGFRTLVSRSPLNTAPISC
jgi:CheY-like chemotaxis protein